MLPRGSTVFRETVRSKAISFLSMARYAILFEIRNQKICKRPENTPKTHGKRIENPGGHSPIRSDRYVPPVRAGFSAQNSLKAGLHFVLSKVETGQKAKIGDFSTVKLGF